MRLDVVGLGGIGGYFGGLLARRLLLEGRRRVDFVARGEHLAAVREHGLRLRWQRPLAVGEPLPRATGSRHGGQQ